MTNAPNAPKPLNSRVKPTLETKFHIDYSWWDREGRDLRTYMISHLPAAQRTQFETNEAKGEVDYIDPETGEVRRLDALALAIYNATRSEDFIGSHSTLVDAVFRVFLENDNKPLSVNELAERLKRPAVTILKTIAGTAGVVYKGLRPITEE